MMCSICSTETWHSMGDINKARELLVCKTCGNVAYKVEPGDEEKLKDYYRKDYRKMPDFTNMITTTNKQNYIKVFLRDLMKGKKGWVCGDVGCATGYLPAFFKSMGHKATGSEYTLGFRRFSEHFYGIPIPEELDTKHKYDLITLYHVLEHMTEPDKKLAHYVSLLAEGGHIMVSCPEWFDTLEEASGTVISTFENLFHKDHINVFSKQSLHNLFAKIGLEIVKEDHIQYGQTYLLKKGSVRARVNESWEEQVRKIETCKKAIELFRAKNYKEAVELWPRFPDAHIKLIFEVHGKDPVRQEDMIKQAVPLIGDSVRFKASCAIWLYQHQKLEEALSLFNELLALKPAADFYVFRGFVLTGLKRHKDVLDSSSGPRCRGLLPIQHPVKKVGMQLELLGKVCLGEIALGNQDPDS
jgi:2-polyprenyl-3-methyl-5-hydroxy-6-metoxy-1,4-benzoquinol methylase